jgi:hypothetical protein
LESVDRFKRQYPELDADKVASKTIERNIYRHQRRDLEAVGLEPAKLQNLDEKAIANMHLSFRSDPQWARKVRNSE